ncbi:transposase [Mesorhizobium abyssinicae]|uniref:transposase n=1 Tax=Mesorhizobium abyssinicae TaxID=1209958 RepID=UPI00387DC75F
MRTSRLRSHRANRDGSHICFVVTNLDKGSAEHIYDVIYCARGQAENMIKMHKSQLAFDRTSCRSSIANQVRLVLHTAAYWLMLTLREAVPTTHRLRNAEFATLRLRLLKLGARVIETVSLVRLAFAAYPEASLFRVRQQSATGRTITLGQQARRTIQLPPSSAFTSLDIAAVKKRRAATCPPLSGKQSQMRDE